MILNVNKRSVLAGSGDSAAVGGPSILGGSGGAAGIPGALAAGGGSIGLPGSGGAVGSEAKITPLTQQQMQQALLYLIRVKTNSCLSSF